jgi:DNA processing protein
VEAADDIVAELAPLIGHMLQTIDTALSPDEAGVEVDEEYVKLLEALGHDPVSADEIVERSGLTIDQVSSMLLILELEGKIEKLSGGRYSVMS